MAKTEIVKAQSGEDGANGRGLDGWALVELFGRQRIVGRISTQQVGVAALIRVDVPDLTKDGKVVRDGFTRFFGPGAIYSITPVTESAVRALLPMLEGSPVKEWEYSFPGRHAQEEDVYGG
jgi:hypothetical protein